MFTTGFKFFPFLLLGLFFLTGCGSGDGTPTVKFVGPPGGVAPGNQYGTTPVARRFGVASAIWDIASDASFWYLGGEFTAVGQEVSAGQIQLSAGGNPNAGCAVGERFNGTLYAIATTSDAIYAGGNFTTYNGQSASRLAKIMKVDCSLDTTFSPPANNGFNNLINALFVSGGALYVGGNFTAYRGVANSANYLAKLDLVNGDIDTTFSPAGATANGFDGSVYGINSDGTSLYVGGSFTAYKGVANSANRIAKLNPASGAIDTTFSPAGATANGFNSTVYTFAIDGNDLYVGGNFSTYKGVSNSAFYIAKLHKTTGAIDTTFSPVGASANGFNSRVNALAIIGTSIYAGGQFTLYRGAAASAFYIAKLDSTGTLDTTFSPPGVGSNGFNAQLFALATDGTSLFAGGQFTAYRGTAGNANYIAKLDPASGAFDATFLKTGSPRPGFNAAVEAITWDGSNLQVAGEFAGYGGWVANRFAKISKDTGALDLVACPQGGAANGFDDFVFRLSLVGDYVQAAGRFTTYRGVKSRYSAVLDRATGALVSP